VRVDARGTTLLTRGNEKLKMKLKIENHERRRSIFHLKFFIFHFASNHRREP
jgi:hypothetical protein